MMRGGAPARLFRRCEDAARCWLGYGNLIADETEKWGKVIRAGNIKP